MSVAFDTSLSGMRSTQTMLDVTANNLANATTFAFKASRVEFSDQTYQNIQAAAGARSTTGGVNPMQVGLGVQVSAITPQLQQGGFEPTGRDLDAAIDGPAYFRLQKPDGSEIYTRLGTFGIDSAAAGQTPKLIDTTTGYRVLNTNGATISPVESIPAVATTALVLSGNLPPAVPDPLHGSTLSGLFNMTLRSDGTRAGNATRLADTNLGSGNGAATTLNVYGETPDGTPYSGTIALAADATIEDLVEGLNDVLTNGTDRFATASFEVGRLLIKGYQPGNGMSLFLGESAPPPAGSGDAVDNSWQHADTGVYQWNLTRLLPPDSEVPLNLSLYTADGTQHFLGARYISTGIDATGGRVWDLVVNNPVSTEGSITGSRVVQGYTFNANGTPSSQPTGSLSTNWSAGGASTVSLQATALTAFAGDSHADADDSTGSVAGSLVSSRWDSQGFMVGTYSNGVTRRMSETDHQLGLATFTNPAGLLADGGSQWKVSANSGSPTYVSAGADGFNAVVGGVLEGSNVDLAGEYTRLILAQRTFESNTKTFQVADEMAQSANNLVS
jgi:flagellar hook protein FlgE